MQGCLCSIEKPELLNYTVKSGPVIKILSEGKTLNLPCATKMPGPIASNILTAHVLMLIEIWINKAKYGKAIASPPMAVVDQTLKYHLEELNIQVDEDMNEDYLSEPPSDQPLNYDQMLNMYMRPVFAEQKGEVERLKAIIAQKEN